MENLRHKLKKPALFVCNYENAGLKGAFPRQKKYGLVVKSRKEGCAICLLHRCHFHYLPAFVKTAGRAYPVIKHRGAAIGA